MLQVKNVEVVYNDVIQVLRGVSIDVPQSSIVALFGATSWSTARS
jgi:branched-chain amino acid transport system ATP-binding protein